MPKESNITSDGVVSRNKSWQTRMKEEKIRGEK